MPQHPMCRHGQDYCKERFHFERRIRGDTAKTLVCSNSEFPKGFYAGGGEYSFIMPFHYSDAREEILPWLHKK